jgi:hypothetical protein
MRRGVAAIVLALVCLAQMSWAQPGPHIAYVYPAGGKQGTKFDVVVGGQFLNGATNAFLSGDGVEARIINYTRPMTQKEANDLREKIQALQEKRSSTNGTFTTADQAKIMELREKLSTFQGRPANPALAETVTLQVELSTNATPGLHEVRLRTPGGLSNPLTFCIGQLPEINEQLPKPGERGRSRPARDGGDQKAVAANETSIKIPAIVNGRVMQGGVDRFRFPGRKGQRIVVVADARTLIPYLPDAVPGWFQAAVSLCDGKGRELAYADHYRFQPDPVLSCVLPADGPYVVEIHDSIYRGRDDFVYRLSIGELPYITSIFPLGGSAQKPATVELKGWNLPVTQLVLTNLEPGVHWISVTNDDLVSNLAEFAVDALPECLEQEPNDLPDIAQRITPPVIVNGRIDHPGDRDAFKFEAAAGQEIVAEVVARRLGSPLDSILKLTDTSGKVLAANDDREDKAEGLETHHADSYLRFRIPANGTYILQLGDVQREGGVEYAYRLRLSAPRPDFALRVTPASLNLRAGGSTPATVYAIRRDGFTDAIDLALSGPAGFKLAGGRIPAGQESAQVTLTAPFNWGNDAARFSLEGRARIDGQTVTRPALPAEDMMQAFAYHHLVPVRELTAVVGGRGGSPKILGATPVKIPAGGTARLRIAAPAKAYLNRVHFDLYEPPEGISLQKTEQKGDEAELVFQCDAKKGRPGLQGNLIVEMAPGQGGGKKAANNQRRSPGTLPAIPFEVVAPKL